MQIYPPIGTCRVPNHIPSLFSPIIIAKSDLFDSHRRPAIHSGPYSAFLRIMTSEIWGVRETMYNRACSGLCCTSSGGFLEGDTSHCRRLPPAGLSVRSLSENRNSPEQNFPDCSDRSGSMSKMPGVFTYPRFLMKAGRNRNPFFLFPETYTLE